MSTYVRLANKVGKGQPGKFAPPIFLKEISKDIFSC